MATNQSDESTFEMFGSTFHQYVLRRSGEQYNTEFLLGGGFIMVWASLQPVGILPKLMEPRKVPAGLVHHQIPLESI